MQHGDLAVVDKRAQPGKYWQYSAGDKKVKGQNCFAVLKADLYAAKKLL